MRVIKCINLLLLLYIFILFVRSILQFNNIVNIIFGLIDCLVIIFAMLSTVIGSAYTYNGKSVKTN